MRCDELRHELVDLSRDPSPEADSHLETCAECQLWLENSLSRPMSELRVLPALAPATLFAKIELPVKAPDPVARQTDTPSPALAGESPTPLEVFWKRLFWGLSFGLIGLAVVVIVVLGPMTRTNVPAETWSFLAPEQSSDWGFLEPTRSAGLGISLFDNGGTIGEWTFLDSEPNYTFLEEEQL